MFTVVTRGSWHMVDYAHLSLSELIYSEITLFCVCVSHVYI